MVYNFSQLSPSVVKTRTLFLLKKNTRTLFLTLTIALLLFGWDEMGYSNSSQVSLFIGEGCGFLQEWVVDANEWVIFTKLLVTLIFNFLSGVHNLKVKGTNSKALESTPQLPMHSLECALQFRMYLNLHVYLNLNQP